MSDVNVFISYRRSDTAGHTGRLLDSLKSEFGSNLNVFMDLETIAPGEDFQDAIGKAVGSCKVLLAMIGESWLKVADAQGKPRLLDANDYVRNELAAALQRNVLVVPILVEGAKMP